MTKSMSNRSSRVAALFCLMSVVTLSSSYIFLMAPMDEI